MQQQSLAPNVITYSAFLSACEKGKQSERAWEIFQEMQQRTNHFSSYISPTEYTYLRLMQTHLACPEETDIERVWELLDLLLLQNPSPSVYTWRTAVQAAVFQGDMAKAVRTLQKIRECTDNGYDEKMGARPMARLIQEQVKKPHYLHLPPVFIHLLTWNQVHVYVMHNNEACVRQSIHN